VGRACRLRARWQPARWTAGSRHAPRRQRRRVSLDLEHPALQHLARLDAREDHDELLHLGAAGHPAHAAGHPASPAGLAFGDALLELILESAPSLLLGLGLGALLQAVELKLPASWFAGGRLAQALRGALVGAPLPICACGILPVSEGLWRRGAGPALTDVVAGHVHFMITTLPSVVGLVQSNSVRPLAVTGDARIFPLPRSADLSVYTAAMATAKGGTARPGSNLQPTPATTPTASSVAAAGPCPGRG
jgi:hypothetical protein